MLLGAFEQPALSGPTGPGEEIAIDLYREHLDEASFLYEQRRDVLLDDPGFSWVDLAGYEDRLEAHLDGLVLGGDLALAVCRQQAAEGDAGELHAVVRVLCRHERKEVLGEVLDALDADDGERVLAVGDALAAELPEAWAGEITLWLREDVPWRQRLAAHVIGYRRLGVGEAVLTSLPEATPEALPDMVQALGRLQVPAARTVLYNEYLRHEVEAVQQAAALALLRLGEPSTLEVLRARAENAPWAGLLLAISGRDVQQPMERSTATPEDVTALGILGNGASIDVLLDDLAEPTLAEAAATALYLITGFRPVEEIFVLEEIDEDELFEDEVEAYRRGELPLRAQGEPHGETVERIAQDPELWRAWRTEQGHRFESGVRYRLGEPYSPMSLVRTLQAPWMPRSIRQSAYEELAIRYHIDASFASDQAVTEQMRAISQLEHQVAEREGVFRPGRWYFAGQLLPT